MIRAEDLSGHGDYRHLSTLQGVAHDLRYAGVHNFAGRRLYGALDCAWLHREAAAGLEAAARWLAEHAPERRLLVLDALRPQRVQEAIWQDVVGTPAQAYFANPARGSIHSFGMAVDVTLQLADGREADMGSGFDEMTRRSHPALHAELLADGTLTPAHVAERACLARALAAGGFAGIDNEWWHFDHGDTAWVRGSLPLVY